MNDLKSELSGNLEDCLLALLEPSVLYDAKCLRRAMRVSVGHTTVILSGMPYNQFSSSSWLKLHNVNNVMIWCDTGQVSIHWLPSEIGYPSLKIN